ncbi:MAG: radical SAM protein [Planctomycetota bacterium]|nr:radical SAM protein [Planctomycetota bacterium]
MFLFINLCQQPAADFIMNRFRPRMPPFGIAYLASILRQIGVKSVLHDDNLKELDDAGMRDLFRRYKGEVRAVGLTSVSTTLGQLARVSRIAKEELPDTPVIVGGPHARLLPDDIIAIPGVDVVFTSEADLTIQDFARGRPLAEIGSILYRDGQRTVQNPPGEFVMDLDKIPFPAYDLFDITQYHTTKGIAKRHPASYLITSRGCPHRCTFCSSKALNPTPSKTVRFRSAENVLGEIEYIVKDYGVRELFFSDDMFTGNTAHVTGVCEGLIRRKLDVVWVAQTHVNSVNPEKLALMRRAGCHQLCFGVESGDPEIQKVIHKNLDLDRVRAAVRMTQEAGIDARCSFMFGNQHETPETMQRTIDFAKRLKLNFASFNIATPYPGTELRTWALENGYLAQPSYERLDSTTYTMVTPSLPPGTVEYYCSKAFRSFYYSPGYVWRRIVRIRDLEELTRVAKSGFYAARGLPTIIRGLLRGRD